MKKAKFHYNYHYPEPIAEKPPPEKCKYDVQFMLILHSSSSRKQMPFGQFIIKYVIPNLLSSENSCRSSHPDTVARKRATSNSRCSRANKHLSFIKDVLVT